MTRLRHILLATDLSPKAHAALRVAIRLAAPRRASVHALCIVDELVIEDLAESSGQPAVTIRAATVESAREGLRRALAAIDGSGVSIVPEVLTGSPVPEILRRAADWPADLLIVARNSASDPARGPGSHALAIARHAPCPVLMTGAAATAQRRAAPPAPPTVPEPFHRIVVGVDFSDHAAHALEMALEMARGDGAAIEAVHLFFGPWNVHHYRAPTPEVSPAFQRRYREQLDQRLRQFVEPHGAAGVPIATRLVSDFSNPGFGLVKFLEEHPADLVVVGTHGRRGLARVLMGSTAERVLRDAPCAVLIVRPTSPRAE
jgi:nucleotide-binding universal stress UspA family protein